MNHKMLKKCSVSISKKSLSISAALGAFINRRVNIYECDNVFAIVNVVEGGYVVHSVSPNSNRKLIHSRPLIRYIQKKYDCSTTINLPAWENDNIIFFCLGDAGNNKSFHDKFTLVSQTNCLRYKNSVRIINDSFLVSSYLSKNLETRLTAYENDEAFAFICDHKGPLAAKTRNCFGARVIKTKNLTEYVKKKNGTNLLFGSIIPHGIMFSKEQSSINKPFSLEQFNVITL